MAKLTIKILGVGCSKCQRLKKKVLEVLEKYQIQGEVIEVTNIDDMLQYGYMMTPGLVINEKLVISGTVPNEKSLLQWIQQALNES